MLYSLTPHQGSSYDVIIYGAGRIVYATIIHAPSSTKNATVTRYP